jgi:hypothetical protein
MPLVNLQAPCPGMTFETRGHGHQRIFTANESGLIRNVEAGSQAFTDLLNSGCVAVQSTQAGATADRPTNPAPHQFYRDLTLGRVIVWDGSAWRDLGEAV